MRQDTGSGVEQLRLLRHQSPRGPFRHESSVIEARVVADKERSSMKPKNIYLLLCVLGIALPYSEFVPWVISNGLNVRLFLHQLMANRISPFFGADVLVSAIVLLTFVRLERS